MVSAALRVVVVLFALGSACAGPGEAAASVCGNAVIETGEDCDDGNLRNLDGCSQTCRYEQFQRTSSLVLMGTSAPSFCTPTTNRLGSQSLTGTALAQINNALATDDATWLFLELIDLDDPSGVSDAQLEVGLVRAVADPADADPTDLDSPFVVGNASVDLDNVPRQALPNGSLAARTLTAGPGDVDMTFLGLPLRLRTTRLSATTSSTSSLPSPPPAQLADGFLAFETLSGDGTALGFCGNATVGSLAQIPVPDAFSTIGGVSACGDCAGSKTYSSCSGGPVTASCNSMLDLLVGGCKVAACFVSAVVPQQPDVGTNGQSPVTITLGAGNKASVTAPDDAYSAYFRFSALRVHVTSNRIFLDGLESGDTTKWTTKVP